jgi:GTP-binding protein Era
MEVKMLSHRSGFAAILGRPNVGKSSLLNRLIGERLAAVSPKAQTTRRRFRGILSERVDGVAYQMVFIDLPGIHVPPASKLLNRYCLEEATDAMEGIDVFLHIIDAGREFLINDPSSDESLVVSTLQRALEANPTAKVIALINKVDLAGGESSGIVAGIRANLEKLGIAYTAILPVAIRKGLGLEPLLPLLRSSLPEHPPFYDEDTLSDENMRVIAAELIQEQLFLHLGEEIPYECAVEVEKYLEPAGNRKKTEIHAAIHVDRASQKQIVVGQGGEKIKEIGQAARLRIEAILGGGLVLKLFVKENIGWTKDVKRMERLGYALPKSNSARNER